MEEKQKKHSRSCAFCLYEVYLLISQNRMRIAATSARVALFCGLSFPADPHHQPFGLVHDLNCGVNGRWTWHIHLKRSAVHCAGNVLSLRDTPQCKAAVEVSIILHTVFQHIPQK